MTLAPDPKERSKKIAAALRLIADAIEIDEQTTATPAEPRRRVRAKELAKILSVNEDTVSRWANMGIIPSEKIGGARFFDVDAVLAARAGVHPQTHNGDVCERCIDDAFEATRGERPNGSLPSGVSARGRAAKGGRHA